MAYPTVDKPYGFKPINRFDGIAYAGATLQYPIASTYNTAIYAGDTVKVINGGTITLSGATTTGNYTEVIVKFNGTWHQQLSTIGTAPA